MNILDNTIEGVACRADRVFSVQYHPESAPGPQDSGYLFDRFIALLEESGREPDTQYSLFLNEQSGKEA